MPDIGRALAGWSRHAEPRETSPCCATGFAGQRALKAELEAELTGPTCCDAAARPRRSCRLDRPLGDRLVASPPLDMAKGGYIAEGYDAALDALRSASADGRRAIAALKRATARRPASRRSRSATMRCLAIISRSPRGTPTG
jgi:DNA mismatch repair protein MutS